MSVILKVDKGTAEKLLQWSELRPDQSRNIIAKELTLEIGDGELVVEAHREGTGSMLEISDLNGSFGVWIELTKDNADKIKSALK